MADGGQLRPVEQVRGDVRLFPGTARLPGPAGSVHKAGSVNRHKVRCVSSFKPEINLIGVKNLFLRHRKGTASQLQTSGG